MSSQSHNKDLNTPTKSESESPPTSSSSNDGFTMGDLTDLIKAIKFAYPDYGIRKVHREIVEVASANGKEPALKDVKLNDVKKIWKKEKLAEYSTTNGPSSAASVSSSSSNPTPKLDDDDDIGNIPTNADSILKFYTVGDGSIQSLADGYKNAAQQAAAAAAEEEAQQQDTGKWFHFFLNVPGDRSGTKPHQALINFSDNQHNQKSNSSNSSKLSKKNSKISEEIVKIQVAAAIPDPNDPKSTLFLPMLLYNADRSARTFLHPPSINDNGNDNDNQEDSDGYHAIYNLILGDGKTGALGKAGGTKGYFRAKIYKEKDVIGIDISSLAPAPTW